MIIRYAPIDGPPLRIMGQTIVGGLTIVAQATYGRVLFRHEIEVSHCRFYFLDPFADGGAKRPEKWLEA